MYNNYNEFQNESPEEGVAASSLQARLPVLTRKMKKICNEFLKEHRVPELAEDLDCFTGNKEFYSNQPNR